MAFSKLPAVVLALLGLVMHTLDTTSARLLAATPGPGPVARAAVTGEATDGGVVPAGNGTASGTPPPLPPAEELAQARRWGPMSPPLHALLLRRAAF